jgi:hypothetical protein
MFKYDVAQARIDADFYALIFFILAIIALFVHALNHIIFNLVGSRITKKVRL